MAKARLVPVSNACKVSLASRFAPMLAWFQLSICVDGATAVATGVTMPSSSSMPSSLLSASCGSLGHAFAFDESMIMRQRHSKHEG